MSTQRISSNATLALNIFFPVFWLVFFGSLTFAVFAYDGTANLPFGTLKWILLAIFLSGAVILYFTLLKLRRVELDEDHLYVTNYFKTYRYPYASVENTHISTFLFLTVAIIRLRERGKLGRNVNFVMAKQLYDDFVRRYPGIPHALKANA